MTIIKDDNHVQQALDNLLTQFQGENAIEGFLTPFIEQVQILEDVGFELYLDRWAATAVGDQLDVLGRIVGREREGRNDDDYRLWISAQILINRSSGTANELLTVIQLITSNNITQITITEYEPATFVISINEALGPYDPQVILAIIKLVKAAGVKAYLQYTPTEPIFTFDIGPGWDEGHLAGIIF